MTPTLRNYQSEAIERVRAARRQGHRRILFTSATGSGKSVIASAMAQRAVELGDRVLVIGHRQELISQFYVHLQRLGITPGILRGQDERTDASSPVQVGTVQTLVRRDLPRAELVVVDEAHRILGASYLQILEAYPRATVLGLTATPCRLDGSQLREAFDTLVEGPSYSRLIAAGAICEPVVYAPKRAPDLKRIRTVGGDYDEAQLETLAMQTTGDVVSTWQRLAQPQNLRTVCFAVTIEHSRELVARFRAAGVRAAHLDGDTTERDRNRLLCELESGTIQLLSNVGVLCEGWDQPSVKCCIDTAPTLSLTRWMQKAGRVLRPWGSQSPLILDHADNTSRHGLPHMDRLWSLSGRARAAGVAAHHVCMNCYAYVQRSPCELCGHVAVATPRKPTAVVPGQLERVQPALPVDPERAQYDKLVEQARKRGFKPGYAAAKWKEAHITPQKPEGIWPPWAWSQATKSIYEQDNEWQLKVARKAKERAFWTEQAAATERVAEYTKEPTEAEYPDDYGSDIPF